MLITSIRSTDLLDKFVIFHKIHCCLRMKRYRYVTGNYITLNVLVNIVRKLYIIHHRCRDRFLAYEIPVYV